MGQKERMSISLSDCYLILASSEKDLVKKRQLIHKALGFLPKEPNEAEAYQDWLEQNKKAVVLC